MISPRTLYGTALAMALGIAGCASRGTAEEPAADREILAPRKVSVTPAEVRDFRPVFESTGTLVAHRQAELPALVDGRLSLLPVDIGTRVRRGELLFEVRTVDYRIALEQAEANLARAETVSRDRARERLRVEGLLGDGSATEQMRDQAVAADEEAAAAVRQAEAARDLALQNLEDCTVVAPHDGVVTARYRRQGEFVGRGDPVIEITDLSTLDAEISVPERWAGTVAVGLLVDLRVAAGTPVVTGSVVAVNPKIDPATRTYLVKARVDNREAGLPAGRFVNAVFRLPALERRTAVPLEGVSRDEGRSRVWIVVDGLAASRDVVLGVQADGWAEIVQGLSAGDLVIVEGASGLVEGSRVDVAGEGS